MNIKELDIIKDLLEISVLTLTLLKLIDDNHNKPRGKGD